MTPSVPVKTLIVDDEPLMMRSLCETLRDRGYDTTGYTNPQDALVALGEHPFDLMLVDLSMPEMDGITLLRRALDMDDRLVGIVMTGEGTVGSAVEAMRTGAYDYILKPFKLDTILPVLQRGLALRALRMENAELERRLREHAAELEAANRELDAFTRSASHDLRGPLANVVSIVSLLQTRFPEDLPADAAKWLQQIDHETHRMMQLLEDLMRLSRLSRQPLTVTHVDVDRLVRSVAEELHQRDPDRQLTLHISSLCAADADLGLLRQVFVNLLANAFKFTRCSEWAEIEVGSRSVDGSPIYWVRDNGVGFDMEKAGRLFEAFQRLHSESAFEGSGVGLTIVQRIIQRHGGRIWAEASPGQGACFYFTLGEESHPQSTEQAVS